MKGIGGSLSKMKDTANLSNMRESELRDVVYTQAQVIERLTNAMKEISITVEDFYGNKGKYYSYTTHVDQLLGKSIVRMMRDFKAGDHFTFKVIYKNKYVACRFKVEEKGIHNVYE